MDNPVLDFFDRQLMRPDLAAIRPEHFPPALDAILKRTQQAADKIAAQTAPADFENTILPLDTLFRETTDLKGLLLYFSQNAGTPEISKNKEQADKAVANLEKSVFQDPKLIARFEQACAQIPPDMNPAMATALRQSFEDGGALLENPQDKIKLQTLDNRLIALSAEWKDNWIQGTEQQAVHITDEARLAGLSDTAKSSFAAAAAKRGKPGWLIVPDRFTVDGVLEAADDPALRREVYEAIERVGKVPPFDNGPVLGQIRQARHERAVLLGYAHHADYARTRNAYTDLGEIREILGDIADKALPKFEDDMRELQSFAAAQQDGPAKLEPWDVSYWAGKQKKELFGFDAQAFAEHLELNNVLNGVFRHYGNLLGVSFKRSLTTAKLHDDIRTYEVLDQTGNHLADINVDLHPRTGQDDAQKDGSAWADYIIRQDKGRPEAVTLNTNVAKNSHGKTCLGGMDDVETIAHELGHGLHAILSNKAGSYTLHALKGPSDCNEFFSTVNEYFMRERETLAGFGIPDAMLDAREKAQNHFRSRTILSYMQNALTDLAFHAEPPKPGDSMESIERAARMDSPHAAHLRPFSLHRFYHLFMDSPSKYAAGYCNYVLADMQAAHGFEPFRQQGYDPENCRKMRAFYEGGAGSGHQERYAAFRGEKAAPDAMLRYSGIISPTEPVRPGSSTRPALQRKLQA
ncbi:MAG: M3 family metallopeptidase [Alphaproteobacteria bacterium]